MSVTSEFSILAIPFLFMLSGIEKEQVHHHLEVLDEKQEDLERAEKIETEEIFPEELQPISSEMTYHEWKAAEDEAEDFYEKSDGLFKKDWGVFMSYHAHNKDIDPAIVYELLSVETGETFDPDLVGPQTKYGRAYGMAQFMTNTGPWIADMADIAYEKDFLYNPYYSMRLSVEYLDYLHDKYEGDWNKALTAYHRGVAGMRAYVEENGDAKSWYAVEIQEKAEDRELVAKE